MTRDQILDLCSRWQDAMARRDIDALAGFYAPDAVLESPLAGTTTGREAFVQAHGEIFAALPEVTSVYEPPIVDGDRVAFVATTSGTHTGNVLGLAATGRAFHFRLVFLWEMKDGLIVRDRRIYDFTGLLVQVGVLKAKPA
jgi:steroid delta-isomerase-like uncharacterized protein